MKVSISTTIEVTEEQREQLARSLDGQGARKRKATRAEFKDFIWEYGAGWESALDNLASDLPAEGGDPTPADDEDLLGTADTDADDDDGMDLI